MKREERVFKTEQGSGDSKRNLSCCSFGCGPFNIVKIPVWHQKKFLRFPTSNYGMMEIVAGGELKTLEF